MTRTSVLGLLVISLPVLKLTSFLLLLAFLMFYPASLVEVTCNKVNCSHIVMVCFIALWNRPRWKPYSLPLKLVMCTTSWLRYAELDYTAYTTLFRGSRQTVDWNAKQLDSRLQIWNGLWFRWACRREVRFRVCPISVRGNELIQV